MTEENISKEFTLRNIYEKRSYFIEEINKNELMSKKHKKVRRVLNYIEHLLILVSTVTGCVNLHILVSTVTGGVSISAFASLVGIVVGITSSAIGLKFV